MEPDASVSARLQQHAIEPIAKPVAGKRALDLLLGGLALAVFSPLLALLMIAVRLDSPGPALYGQERVGQLGKPFRMWKLRSMRSGSSHDFHRSVARNWFEGAPIGPEGYKPNDDHRLTRVGRYLRRTSLDELPQLLNVLRGEMSLVGPRPAIPYELEHYRPSYYERQRVPPGMTGLWQVRGRDRLSAPEMMALDVSYVRRASVWLDIQILAWTVTSLIKSPTRHPAV